MNIPEFKYFKDPLKNAEFTDARCEICGTDKYCLEGVYFDDEEDIESVCIECLKQGKSTVYIPEYIEHRLEKNLRKYESVQDEKQLMKRVQLSIEELERTPPVPWIQYNAWEVCCGDFAMYVGEWEQEDIIEHAPNKNGKEYLLSILEESYRNRIDSIDVLWEAIEYDTAIFVFKCLHCSKYIAVWQSY